MSVTDAPSNAGPPATTDPQVTEEQSTSDRRQRLLGFVERYALVGVFFLMMAFFTLWSKTSKHFLTTNNVKFVVGDKAVVGILAMAIIIPLVCGEFDFSVGSVAGISQILCAGFMARLGAPLVVAVGVGVGVGIVVGLSNGNTVARIGVNSLIVTLGVSSVLLGIINWYTKGQSIINGISKDLTKVGSGDWFGVPRTVYFLAVVAALVYYLLEHTPYGRYLHSIGSNREAARLVGLPVERLVLIAFVLSGALAGVAGVLLVARNGGGNPQVGNVGDTLQALSAAFLGATAIKPGRFNVIGTIVAIFFLAFTVTGLSLAGVAAWINDVFNGAALFVAVLISTVIGRKRVGG